MVGPTVAPPADRAAQVQAASRSQGRTRVVPGSGRARSTHTAERRRPRNCRVRRCASLDGRGGGADRDVTAARTALRPVADVSAAAAGAVAAAGSCARRSGGAASREGRGCHRSPRVATGRRPRMPPRGRRARRASGRRAWRFPRAGPGMDRGGIPIGFTTRCDRFATRSSRSGCGRQLRRGCEAATVAQHRPQYVYPATGQGENGLRVALPFGAFALVVGARLGRAALQRHLQPRRELIDQSTARERYSPVGRERAHAI
jgi:hypothetical protein